MSTELREMLGDRAERLDAPGVDPVALIAAAGGRLRRRRLAWAGGVAAWGAVTALLVPGQLGGSDTDRPVADDPSVTTALVWVRGSTLHAADGSTPLDLGRRPVSLVQGRSGYAFSDPEGTVYTVIDSEVLAVGRMEAPKAGRFESDGDVVAWVDAGDGEPRYAAVDLSRGPDVVSLPVSGRPASPVEGELDMSAAVAAVDGDRVYLRTEQGADVWRPFAAGQEVETLPVQRGTTVELYDVEDGVFHFRRRGGTSAQKEETVLVGPDLASPGTALPSWDGDLSPDGRYLVSETADENQVYDTTTGRRLPFQLGDYAFLAGYRWLDEDTYAALALRGLEDTALDLLRCEAQTGACEPVVQQEPLEGHLLLPVGQVW